ncbi:hypothetical protein FOCG_18416 [Fusarium oxysporum f. sp. radicis-lycopersici 26381]|nr:hypothetical protein FOCG_18416 [Fusarium oxysporum f. sp. radicis-lycopersici 26381]
MDHNSPIMRHTLTSLSVLDIAFAVVEKSSKLLRWTIPFRDTIECVYPVDRYSIEHRTDKVKAIKTGLTSEER